MESVDERFVLKNARFTRVKELPKVCFLTVMCQCGKYPNYYDVVVFQPPGNVQLEEGLAVTISGELSKSKPKDGGNEWKLQLVARKFEPGDDRTAPRPKRSEDGQRHTSKPAREEFANEDDYPPF